MGSIRREQLLGVAESIVMWQGRRGKQGPQGLTGRQEVAPSGTGFSSLAQAPSQLLPELLCQLETLTLSCC